MPVKSKDDLVAALERGDFAAVLGSAESEWLEFKSEPYLFDNTKGPREYAKDVAALANAGGGMIVIGYKTDKAETELQSSASDHRPIPKNLVDAKKAADVLEHVVYPQVKGVSTAWFPSDPAQEKGVLVGVDLILSRALDS